MGTDIMGHFTDSMGHGTDIMKYPVYQTMKILLTNAIYIHMY